MKHKVSPSMVVATIALVVALSGTGLAAVLITTNDIADNTIRSRDVRNGTLQSVDVKDGTLVQADLATSVRRLLTRQVLFAESPNSGMPTTITNEFAFTSNLAVPVTTTKAGRLWIDATANYDILCSVGTSAWFFLMVDNVPVRSSAIRVAVDSGSSAGSLATDRHLSGITSGVIPAGVHTITAGAQCGSGSQTGSAASPATRRQSVIVLE